MLWRVPVGTGSNHPSVAGDDLCFAQLDDDGEHETVKCLDANTGRDRWSHTYPEPPIWHVGWGELGVRATPTINDQYVHEVGTFGDSFCFERKTGKIVWKHNFREESPYLDGSLKDNGNLEWKGFNGSLVPIGDKLWNWECSSHAGRDHLLRHLRSHRQRRDLSVRSEALLPGSPGHELLAFEPLDTGERQRLDAGLRLRITEFP